MKMQRGSFTIEAVILIPLILCLMIGILQEGIYFYQKSIKEVMLEIVKEWNVVDRFYELWVLKELEEEIDVE